MRLIDADKLETHDVFDGEEWNVFVYKDDIDALPSVNAVEVVRCKNCKQWDAELGCCTSYTITKCTDGREGVSSEADDFCSRGVKKDEC